MGESTEIAWTDHTFNPWIGCERVSDGCRHCYAEALSKRWGWGLWGKNAPRRVTSNANWRQPRKWDKAARLVGRPALVFCASLADVFEDRPDLREPRHRLFELIRDTPHLRWLLLTKRPENVLRLVPPQWLQSVDPGDHLALADGPRWPHNVWVGATVEHQAAANARLPYLVQIPAPVLFLSHEPALGRVDLPHAHPPAPGRLRLLPGVDWVISGGESGAGHRPLDVDHARHMRDQCEVAGIPFFFKQHGGRTPKAGGDLLDGVRHHVWPAAAQRTASSWT